MQETDEKILYNLSANQVKFIEALKCHPFDVAKAAEQAKLSRRIHHYWIDENNSRYNADYKAAVEEVMVTAFDHLEGELDFRIDGQYILRKKEDGTYELDAKGRPIRDYINPPDNSLLKFKLLTKGKHLGYVYRTEMTGADSNPLFGGFELNIRRKNTTKK